MFPIIVKGFSNFYYNILKIRKQWFSYQVVFYLMFRFLLGF